MLKISFTARLKQIHKVLRRKWSLYGVRLRLCGFPESIHCSETGYCRLYVNSLMNWLRLKRYRKELCTRRQSWALPQFERVWWRYSQLR